MVQTELPRIQVVFLTVISAGLIGTALIQKEEKELVELEELRSTQYTQQLVQPSSYQIFEHPANQVFRDHNGYRVIWTDDNRQIQEKKYFNYADIHNTVSILFQISQK